MSQVFSSYIPLATFHGLIFFEMDNLPGVSYIATFQGEFGSRGFVPHSLLPIFSLLPPNTGLPVQLAKPSSEVRVRLWGREVLRLEELPFHRAVKLKGLAGFAQARRAS